MGWTKTRSSGWTEVLGQCFLTPEDKVCRHQGRCPREWLCPGHPSQQHRPQGHSLIRGKEKEKSTSCNPEEPSTCLCGPSDLAHAAPGEGEKWISIAYTTKRIKLHMPAYLCEAVSIHPHTCLVQHSSLLPVGLAFRLASPKELPLTNSYYW